MSQKMIFVNLPVKDLERSKEFYTHLGYSINEQFSDENAASIVISDTIVAMLLKESFYSTFTSKEIVDANKASEVLLCLSADSKAEVDELADKALAGGGSKAGEPQEMPGMYGRSFSDPDGHHWEIMWMDMSAEG